MFRVSGVVCLVAAVVLAASAAPVRAADVLVFAASSTTTALAAVIDHYRATGGGDVAATFGSSGALAQQIVSGGAPAHIFISANYGWIQYLDTRRVISAGGRRPLMANRLALVAPTDSTARLTVAVGFPLRETLGDGRLALADPRHVPAGTYAMNALKSLGVWEDVAPLTVRTRDVRAALALVERGEVPLGVVYTTDAAISKKVRTVAVIPQRWHRPIRYAAAIVSYNRTPAAKRYYEFLWSDPARAIFRRHGFDVDPKK